MPNTSVQASAEGVSKTMTVQTTESLNAEDLVYECVHLSQLVFMAIEDLELNEEMKALSAGIYVIRRKLLDAVRLMDVAKNRAQ
ncbi:hypothetical protein [Rhizobium leguminosarum]|uniref:hypothetical protein n=1 Tax=Rhizobium leguminosarum TaxID=384 RepID=UPI001031B0BD|nr:hypothetical protein [Rhizobium leguminosarum]TAX09313.1 hypothetical protein ELI07_07275 [Rhizobium leguminosarum]TAY11832.1 hypothetical protein ELH96_08800 [Rhizobium leguminosarum]